MIVHSFDDEIVPIEYGYEIFYEKYKDDSRLRLKNQLVILLAAIVAFNLDIPLNRIGYHKIPLA